MFNNNLLKKTLLIFQRQCVRIREMLNTTHVFSHNSRSQYMDGLSGIKRVYMPMQYKKNTKAFLNYSSNNIKAVTQLIGMHKVDTPQR